MTDKLLRRKANDFNDLAYWAIRDISRQVNDLIIKGRNYGADVSGLADNENNNDFFDFKNSEVLENLEKTVRRLEEIHNIINCK